MSVKVWARLLFVHLFISSRIWIPFENNKKSGYGRDQESTVFSQSKEAVEDLLMFWEGKILLVQSATRNEKPISQVAENMTVITAKDIEDMNAQNSHKMNIKKQG